MKGFKKIIGSLLLTMGLATGFAFHATAADETIDGVIVRASAVAAATFPEGVTEVTATKSATTMVGGRSLQNKTDIFADAADGAVIRPVVDSGKTEAELYYGLWITAGTVTIDLTGLDEGVSFRMAGSLWLRDNGKLVIKGRNAIDWGTLDEPGLPMPAAIRADEISFVDADGDAYGEPGTINFSGYFAEVKMPSNVNWIVEEGSTAFIYQSLASGLVARYTQGGVFALDTFDVTLMDPAGVPDVKFEVDVGRTLKILPRTLVHEAGILYNGNSRQNCNFANDVELSGDGAVLLYGYNHNVEHSGAVSGRGTVRYLATASTASEKTTLSGALTFVGDFDISCSSGSPLGYIVIKQATPGDSGNTVKIGAGCTLKLDPADPAEGSIAALTGPGTLSLGKVRLTLVSEPTGDAVVMGAGADKTTVVRGWPLAAGEYSDAGADGTYAVDVLPEAMVGEKILTRTNGSKVYYRPTVVGGVLVVPDMDVRADAGLLTLEAVDGETYGNLAPNVRVLAKAGISATVVLDTDKVPVLEAEAGATISTVRKPFDYATAASFWVDADKESSWTQLMSGETPQTVTQNRLTYKAVDYWHDCRGAREDMFLRCDKYNLYNATIVAYAVTNGLNGRTYMSLYPENRRMAIWNREGVEALDAGTAKSWGSEYSSLTPQYCVMVFGSQGHGGGCALVADKDGYFVRGGAGAADNKTNVTKDSPIFANNIPVYVDGESKAATETGLSGGWQIISFPTFGKKISGLGFTKLPGTTTTSGYGNYAEVLFFDTELTDAQRVTVERALAKKWGLEGQYHDSGAGQESFTVDVRGQGTVRLGTATTVAAGSFRGTLVADGQDVTFAAADRPPMTDVVVTNTVTPLCWFDPGLTDADHADETSTMAGPMVNIMYDVRYGKTDGTSCLNSAGRSPLRDTSAHGEGPVRNWLDYSPLVHGGATANGRSMRFNIVGSGKDSKTIDGAPSARTVIMAQDSVKSGGTPFMDTIAGSTLSQRNPAYVTNGETTQAKPIWVGNSVGVFQDGATYLDGVAVDGSVAGFTGGPEILTAVGGANFTLGDFGNLYYLNGRNPNDIDAGEIQGEIVVYGEVLSDAQRKSVEAYLSWKWCGKAINGYAVHTNTTITGNGTVTVASLDQMPQFAAGFTGKADLSAISELAFSIDPKAGTVDGAIANPGTLAFPAAVTAKVSFMSRMKAGKYALVTAAGGLDRTAWTLDLGVDPLPDNVKLNVTATKVELEVQPLGLMMLVR